MNFWERLAAEVDSRIERKRLFTDLGLAPNSLTTWTKRRTYPAANVIVAIARALGVSVEYLVAGEDPAGLPADFLRDCRLLQENGALGPVRRSAHAEAEEFRAATKNNPRNASG